MPSSVLRIIQLGDLHYKADDSTSAIDDKDPAISRSLVSAITPNPLEDNLRTAILMSKNYACDAVIAMGDVVDKGHKEFYADGVHLLLDAFVADDELRNRTILLPGNHDINRADALIGIPNKFDHINVVARAMGLPAIAVDQVTLLPLKRGICSAPLFAMNSCVGCGERRSLPERIGAGIEKLISDQMGARTADPHVFPDMLSQYYEQLDTPAFSDNAINSLRDLTSDPDTKDAPLFIVAAHHNLLPQAQPRIAPYSELLNAGQLRNLLLEFQRPVIYLHGHIHTDPVEIVYHPARDSALLVTISAPELRRGFNIIEILFNKDGRAFGCRVREFRISEGGKPTEHHTIRIPFYRHVQQAMSQLNGAIIKIVYETSHPLYWPDLVKQLKQTGINVPQGDLEQAIRELSWNRFLTLQNEDAPQKQWRVERPL
jgi:Calcineurin-like phosphoesterase